MSTHDIQALPVAQHHVVFREQGAFAGWPANYGMWAWGNEILTIFLQGRLGGAEQLHARDKAHTFTPQQARSRDGGVSWSIEPFSGRLPGRPILSGDEHVVPQLQAGPFIDHKRDFEDLPEPIDFSDPETIVLCARTGLHAQAASWFYVSRNRGASWSGPYAFPHLAEGGIAARTDIVPLGQHDALFLLSTAKRDGREGRVFCARTQDGGRSFRFVSFVGDEPAGFSIMPSSVRLADGGIVAAIRSSGPDKTTPNSSWIDIYRSDDLGESWREISRAVANAGFMGNPPALALLPDQRLALVYGFRDRPYGIRAKTSADGGVTWGDEIIVRDDAHLPDLGYPRLVVRADGKLVTTYYFNDATSPERYIAASVLSLG